MSTPYASKSPYVSKQEQNGEKISLVSPIMDFKETSCYGFLYISSNVHYHVYRYSFTEREEIISIERYEQHVVWHSITANIPAGKFGIIIEIQFVSGQDANINGIANVIVRPGSCEHLNPGDF